MYWPGGPGTGPYGWWTGSVPGTALPTPARLHVEAGGSAWHVSTAGVSEEAVSALAAESISAQGRAPWWLAQLPAPSIQSGSRCCRAFCHLQAVRGEDRTGHSGWVLVAGEAAESLPQGSEAGPLLRALVPACEHQPVGTGWALGGAGHAVARVYSHEGLVVGHACGRGTGRLGDQCPPAIGPPRMPWATLSPTAPPHPFPRPSLWTAPRGSEWCPGNRSKVTATSHTAWAQYLDRASGPC